MNTKSSVIINYAYHDGGLEITFKGGRTYRYDAPPRMYDFLHYAGSKGEFYNARIRGHYDSHEVPLRQAVDLAIKARAMKSGERICQPEIYFANDVIVIGNTPYGGGAESITKYFIALAERYIK